MHSVPAAIRRGGGHLIGQSLIFNDDDGAYLSRTFATPTNRLKWSYSSWMKRGVIDPAFQMFFEAATNNQNRSYFAFNGDKMRFNERIGNVSHFELDTAGVWRDPSTHMNVVLVFDSANATQADRLIIYVDGIRQDLTGTQVPLNQASMINHNVAHRISGTPVESTYWYDGYMAEVVFLDGQALTPDQFGTFNRKYKTVWEPEDVSGLDYSGVNSFHLDFADPSDIGKDVSGNGNSWASVNLVASDVVTDSPTNNVCTFNPIDKNSVITLSEGNKVATQAVSGDYTGMCTMGLPNDGLFYWEVERTQWGAALGVMTGVLLPEDHKMSDQFYCGGTPTSWSIVSNLTVARAYTNTISTYLFDHAAEEGDTLQVAFNATTRKIWFGIDGVWSGDPAAGTGEVYSNIPLGVVPAYSLRYSSTSVATGHFTEEDFKFTPPAGFLPLSSANLPEPVIKNPKKYFDPQIYTGDGTSPHVIPTQNKVDHVVVKSRNLVRSWQVTDSIRGANKQLLWDTNGVEDSVAGMIVDLGATNGFTVGAHAAVNASGDLYVAYPFTKSPIAGMDIVAYTGNGAASRAIPHSLGIKPNLMIVKERHGGTLGWMTYFESLSADGYVRVDLSNAYAANALWGNTEPDAANFNVGAGNTNGNTDELINYLFASIEGFSKVFSYIGNGNEDGPFIHCGFKPAFVMIKSSSVSGDWTLHDLAREPYNPLDKLLAPNQSAAEGGSDPFADSLSNGIKIRNTYSWWNQNGGSYVGIAFAEAPFGVRGK